MSTQIIRRLLPLTLLGVILLGCSPPVGMPTTEETILATITPSETATSIVIPGNQDIVVLSLEENGYAHLFLYIPQQLPLTRLTYGEWDDTQPALSPDGSKVAFSSNRDGYWDLYTLDLQSGETTRVTNSPEFESSPSWSPDSQWLACEFYQNENLDIAIVSLTLF